MNKDKERGRRKGEEEGGGGEDRIKIKRWGGGRGRGRGFTTLPGASHAPHACLFPVKSINQCPISGIPHPCSGTAHPHSRES